MQKPGEVVFGCSTCDSELCAKCALDTATSEEIEESLDLIAKVTQMFVGESSSRFVATPTGAVLDTSSQLQQKVPCKAEGPPRTLESIFSETFGDTFSFYLRHFQS